MIAHISKDQREETVVEHCVAVAQFARTLGKEVGLEHTAFLTALIHDLGKGNSFEIYLKKAIQNPSSVRRGSIDHSTAGAKYIFETYYGEEPLGQLTAQLIATAICSHHGLYDMYKSDGTPQFKERLAQNEGLDYENVLKENQELLVAYDLDTEFELATKEVERFIKQCNQMMGGIQSKGEEKNYDFPAMGDFWIASVERLLLSILIQSDHLMTAEFMSGKPWNELLDALSTQELWQEWIRTFDTNIQKKGNKSTVGQLRGDLLRECMAFAEKPSGIYTLEIPTGGGKTFSGLRYALGHAAQHQKRRIFYVSPLLAILEQNALEMKAQLSAERECPDTRVEAYTLEHHSNIILEDQEEGSDGSRRYQQLTETWDSPFIMTTMVQFLNTLFDGSMQSIRRMHRLSNAVIIIDEIQSLPIKCVYLFNMMMSFLSRCCGATVVLCSATQPLLDQVGIPINYGKPESMIADRDHYEQAFKRVEITPLYTATGALQTMDTEALVDFVLEKFNGNLLIILNTKAAVRKLHFAIKQRLEEMEGGPQVNQLTTYMCAAHRSDRIETIKAALAAGEPLICISTQLIEAGVDISFKGVIRSLAGLDSIAQAAGRCNRNGEVPLGSVFVLKYDAEHLDKLPDIKKAQDSMEAFLHDYKAEPEAFGQELLSRKSMDRYYLYYFRKREGEMAYPFDDGGIINQIFDVLSNNRKDRQAYRDRFGEESTLMMHQAFKRAGKAFEVIGNTTIGLIVPYGNGKALIAELWDTPEDDVATIRRILRSLQRYTINVYPTDTLFKEIQGRGGIERTLMGGKVFILSESFYGEDGLSDELKLEIF